MQTLQKKEEVEIYFSQKAQNVLEAKSRYKVLYGGRGGGKSYNFADWLIIRASNEKLRILCTREMQNSIRDSVYRLLCDRIAALQLEKYFTVQRKGIFSKTGSEILF